MRSTAGLPCGKTGSSIIPRAVSNENAYNTAAADRTPLRSAAEQAAIWKAYAELVAYAARHLQLVTSADLVKLAGPHK